MQDHAKLYIVTRSDISPGQRATQSAHAAFLFSVEHPLLTKLWYQESTYLVLLCATDEPKLAALATQLQAADRLVSLWREPDLNNELTAIAVEPGTASSRILANLPLTLREEAMVT
jgi:hypothetical protein